MKERLNIGQRRLHWVAQYQLSVMYEEGDGVEKDIKKQLYHLEEAASVVIHQQGTILEIYENARGRDDRAVKHFIIAAKLGYDDALEAIKTYFASGFVSKEDFEAALREHQAAVDATKSAKRKEAYAFFSSN